MSRVRTKVFFFLVLLLLGWQLLLWGRSYSRQHTVGFVWDEFGSLATGSRRGGVYVWVSWPWRGGLAKVNVGSHDLLSSNLMDTPQRGRLGFTQGSGFQRGTGLTDGTYNYVTVPHWFLTLVLGLVLFALGRRAWRRRPAGLCPNCGYDLRESPDRCPECGRPVRGRERIAADEAPASAPVS